MALTWWNALFFLFIALGLLSSCSPDSEEFVPDVSGIEAEVSLRRFELDLFGLDTNNLSPGLEKLKSEYPEFSEIYFGPILGASDPQIAGQEETAYIRGFLTHPAVRRLYDTCMVVYPDMEEVQEQFREAFRFYKYYFPGRPAPDLTTFISEYTVAAFIYDEHSLAVGLDFFLGESYPYQKYNPLNPAFSAYMTRTFNRDHLVSKTLQPLIEDLLGSPPGDRLLDMMIYNGKKGYILDKLLPYTPDSVIVETSAEQLAWMENNELEMWAYFLEEELLYSSDYQKVRKFVEYSPHSPGMPPEAPGGTGNWLGRQIVRAYMQRFPETSMTQLIELKNPQELLDRSRYKPRR